MHPSDTGSSDPGRNGRGNEKRHVSSRIVFSAGASLAQSAARQSHNLKVVSSSLTGGTFFHFCELLTLLSTVLLMTLVRECG